MKMIELIDVNKKYKNNVLFEHVNCHFDQGRIHMIKGPNGSGKSVLLKLIVGYARPDSGVVRADGIEIRKDADFLPNAGVFINSPEFMNQMTGWDNLVYLSSIRKRCSKDELMNYVEYYGLQDFIHQKVKSYSEGMKQKLRIIQAVMDKPDYLILDEPFDTLDDNSIQLTFTLLKEYMTEKRTIILTNHIAEADEIADMKYAIGERMVKKQENFRCFFLQ